MSDSIGQISMLVHDLSVQNEVNTSYCKQTNRDASFFFV